jgi:hypothetical protein
MVRRFFFASASLRYADLRLFFPGEYLEWIVIILIAAEIFVAGINIVVDLYAGE